MNLGQWVALTGLSAPLADGLLWLARVARHGSVALLQAALCRRGVAQMRADAETALRLAPAGTPRGRPHSSSRGSHTSVLWRRPRADRSPSGRHHLTAPGISYAAERRRPWQADVLKPLDDPWLRLSEVPDG
jgi:hypothetical protein